MKHCPTGSPTLRASQSRRAATKYFRLVSIVKSVIALTNASVKAVYYQTAPN